MLAAAILPLRDLAGAFEEQVIWRLSDRLRSTAEAIRWPFERLAWSFEQRLLWPLQERLPGWEAPPRAAGAGALAAVAIAAVVIGVLALEGGDGQERLPGAERVVAVTPAPPPEEKPSGPVLQGVAPRFGVGDDAGAATSGAAAEGAEPAAAPDAGDAATAETTDGAEGEAGATTSSKKPVPAGPAAMKVARRFSEAFVYYEIGERPKRAVEVFQQTATPELATALAERPPRQPQSTEVPRARVLNLVPGPRSGGVYTVSASLLRVGTISELRLKLAKQAGAWRVTDVRG